MNKSFSVCKQYKDGIPIYKIREQTGLTRQQILEILYDNNTDLSGLKIKLSKELQDQIISLYKNGIDPTNIGRIIKKSSSCIREFLIIHGFKFTLHDLIKRLSIHDKNEIIEMFKNGRPIYNIAKSYKTNSVSIKRLLSSMLSGEDLQKIQTYKEKHIICKKCNLICYNYQTFSKHLKKEHNLSIKQYYNIYFKKSDEGICIVCNRSSDRFISFEKGYSNTCCRSCAAKIHRAKLRDNKEKFNIFRQKVSEHHKKWFYGLSADEVVKFRCKISSGLNAFVSQLSEDEKKKKFGWMNKLSEEQRHDYIINILLQSGCHKWWKESDNEQKRKVYEKRRKTLLENKGYNFEEYVKTLKFQKELYAQRVRCLTEITFKKYKDIINPSGQNRSKNWQVDHKFSISEGFKNNIEPEIIAHYTNLQMLTNIINIKKNDKCSITKEELLDKYEKSFAL